VAFVVKCRKFAFAVWPPEKTQHRKKSVEEKKRASFYFKTIFDIVTKFGLTRRQIRGSFTAQNCSRQIGDALSQVDRLTRKKTLAAKIPQEKKNSFGKI